VACQQARCECPQVVKAQQGDTGGIKPDAAAVTPPGIATAVAARPSVGRYHLTPASSNSPLMFEAHEERHIYAGGRKVSEE